MFVVTNLVSAFSQQNSADLVKMLLLLITVPVQGEKACLARAYDARRRRVLVGKEGASVFYRYFIGILYVFYKYFICILYVFYMYVIGILYVFYKCFIGIL